MNRKSCISTAFAILALCQLSVAQTWTNNDYKKALWMTTRFYGAQRSGNDNWAVYNHLPGGVSAALRGKSFLQDALDGNDLSGGWHDCGDHVKFGNTQFYAAYILLKGYSEFPTGYDDKYTYDYAGYIAANDWTYEGAGHDPNCIPDVLEEVKHATDYFIKCTPNSTTFYYQCGQGSPDHTYWETSVKMQTEPVGSGGEVRTCYKNPNDGSMAGFCAATLALMSRLYAPYDATYASTCLTHAVYAYNYAKSKPSTAGAADGFYPANGDYKDEWATMCAELYWTTSNNAYKTEAVGYEPTVNYNAGWPFDYANNGEIALYNLAKLGNASALTRFNNRITGYYISSNRDANGLFNGGSNWGMLRYNAISAFLVALYSKLNSNTTAAVLNPMYKDIDYIMGNNTSKLSFIVGFVPSTAGYTAAQKPHHRNIYLNDTRPAGTDNTLTIPAKNQQFGALVGGDRNSSSYPDVRDNYQYTEVCVDYNAPLVGALAYINSLKAPVTISCADCWQPNMGPDISTCSSTLPVTLNANAGAPGGSISYRWYTWDGTTKTIIGGATGQTYSASSLGGYIVERDSAYTGGPCTKRDTIWISNTLTKPALGADPAALCSPAFVNLTPSNTASFPGGTTWQWYKASALAGPYSSISGATSSTLSNVRVAGYYRVVATSGSCTNADTIHITSSLPTPVDGCRSGTGTVNLSITNPGLNGTNYNWYAASTGGSPLAGGTATTSFTTPSISTTTTYYVEDMSSVSATVGRASNTTALNNGGSANLGINFDAYATFNLNSVDVPLIYYSAGSQTIQIEIQNSGGTAVKTSAMITISDVSGGSGYPKVVMATVNVNLTNIPGTSPVPTSYKIVQIGGTAQLHRETGGSYCFPCGNNPGSGNVVKLTSSIAYGANNTSSYEFFYNWQITTGTPCDRLPVVATVGTCSSLPVELVNFFATNNKDYVYLTWNTAKEENNDRFEVERSEDGEHFTSIGKLTGNGTKNSLSTYSYNDFSPVSGIAYYRLAQYDIDGKVTYSHVEAVDREDHSRISVVPNPFTNSADLMVSSSVSAPIVISISDLSGKILWSSEEYSTNEIIPVGAELSKGVYIIHATQNDSVYTTRMIKQ